VSACEIVVPEPAVAPETPDCTTVQVNVVPATLLVSVTDGAAPEQIVCKEGVAVITGVGFTVIATFLTLPEQAFAVATTL
jgi:hypothetical protein